GNAHARLRLAVRAVGHAGLDGDIGERAVVVVLVERCGGGVVGDVDVGPAVIVEIGCQHAEAVSPRRFQNAGLLGNITEHAGAVVVVEDVLAAGQAGRPASHHEAFVKAGDRLR